jgi:hypothetical protein
MELITRDDWGAKHGRGTERRSIRAGVVLHHFASPHVDCGVSQARECEIMRDVEHQHAAVNGWAGIGYHFVVFQSGRIYEGRGWERVGAHAPGHNSTHYGIALAIDGSNHEPTPAAIEAVKEVIAGAIRWGYLATDYTLMGHRDTKPTACPGDKVYARLGEFRA